MNRSYCLVWNRVRNCLMVASETTKSQGKASGSRKIVIDAVTAAVMLMCGTNVNAETTWDPATDYNYTVDGTPLNPNVNNGLSATNVSVGALTLTSNGSINNNSGGSNGVSILAGSSLSGGIANSGTITGSNNGISISDSSSILGGITNTGIINSFNAGISFERSFMSGNIANAGLISGTNGGISLTNSSLLIGGIANTGRISSIGTGISIQSHTTLTGGIVNSGTIEVGGTALLVKASIINGGIVNSGAISAGGVDIGIALLNASTLNGGIINRGVISGGVSGDGILLRSFSSVSGGVTNSGSITGGGNGITLLNNSSLLGGIHNSGVVSGNIAGIAIHNESSVAGGIVNSGLIKGGPEGIAVYSATSISQGITNSGIIKGDSRGIRVSSTSSIIGGITNSGLISGTVNSIYVEGSSSLDNIVIAGNNTASFSGAVDAPNTTVTVASSATYTLDTNFNVNNFVNAGTLIVPTASVATPVISGALTLQNGGTFIPTISSINNYTQVAVTGDVNIGGALVINSPMMPVGTTLVGLITGNSVTGAFASSSDNSYLYNYVPIYTGTALNLAVLRDSSTSFTQAVQSNNNSVGVGAAGVLDGMSGNPSSAMSSVMSSFGQMKTAQQVSNAVSQTLPVIMGASSQAAAQSQQFLNQIMQGRQNQLRGLSSGEEFIGTRDVWMKGYGSWANQDSVNNVSGYKVNTGGLAVGVDRQISPKSNIGAVFAFGNSSVSSNNSAAPSGITVNSYQIGAYGDYALQHDWQTNYQADIGFNNNKSYRNLSDFGGVQGIGSNANANYNSTVAHLGAGLRHFVPLAENTTFIPSIRADYTTVQSQGYTESGGGALNLNVNSQSYNMMMFSADLRLDHELADKLKVSANVGGGYNTLNNQVQITSAYQGGGSAFVTNGLQVSPWLYNAGLGLAGRIDKSTELNVRYDTQFTTTSYTNQIVSAKLKFWY